MCARRTLQFLASLYCIVHISENALAAEPERLVSIDSHHFGHKSVTEAATLQPSAPPNAADIGRLYFQTPQLEVHYCTAQFVEPGVVLTAAHCTHDRLGNAYKNFCYIPPDVPPVSDLYTCSGGIKATCVAWNQNWLSAINWKDANFNTLYPDNLYISARFDYAFVKMASDGSSGATYPTPATHNNGQNRKKLQLVGYPRSQIDPAAAGKSQMIALQYGGFTNGFFHDVLHPKLWASGVGDANFTAGVSGGAWFHLYGNVMNPQLEIVSLNSSYAENTDNESSADNPATYRVIYGPQFDQDTVTLRAEAAKSSGIDPQICQAAHYQN